MSIKDSILIGVGLVDNASKRLDTMADKWRARSRNLSSVGSEMSQGVTLPIVAAGAATLKFAGDFDALKKALAANMGSARAAGVEFEKLRELAEAPGIGFEEALKGSIQLQALNATADESRYILGGLAKAIELSGGGAVEFSRAMEQMIQMLGRGKLMQEDLKFMFQSAPKMRGIVNQIFGTSNPEELRNLTNVKEFVQKTWQELYKLQGTGGSVKNAMENLWTSFKIGAGEIGLAVLALSGWDKALGTSANAIEHATGKTVAWINENKELTKHILYFLGVVAVTGPITRLVGNLGLLVSVAAKVVAGIGMATAALLRNTVALASNAAGWRTIGAALGPVAMIFTAISTVAVPIMTKELNTLNNKLSGTLTWLERVDAAMKGIAAASVGQFGKAADFFNAAVYNQTDNKGSGNNKSSMYGRFGDFIPGTPMEAPRHLPAVPNLDFLKSQGGGGGKDKGDDAAKELEKRIKAARKLAEDRRKWAQELFDIQKEVPLGANKFLSGDREMGAGILSVTDKIAPRIDAINAFKDALRAANLEGNFGASVSDILSDKMDAAKEAYMSLATAFGADDLDAQKMLSQWQSYANELAHVTAKEKELAEAMKEREKRMEMMQGLVSGLADAFVDLATGGKDGFKDFGQAILGMAKNMLKLLVTTVLTNIATKLLFNPLGGASSIAGGIPMIGGIAKAIAGVSLAEGGMLTGETLVRAGEYSGVQANPEVISPVDKIQSYIRDAVNDSGGGGGVVDFKIGFNALYGSMQRAHHNRGRSLGSRLSTI